MVVSAFSSAIDVLFANPNLAVDTVYRPGGVGSGISVRAIARRADRIGEFGDTRLLAETTLFDIRVSEIAEPAEGDTVEIDGVTYIVQGTPVRDAERLIWTIEGRA